LLWKSQPPQSAAGARPPVPAPSTNEQTETIEASGTILGIAIGSSLEEARAKLDPLRAEDEHTPDAKEVDDKRVYWKLRGTEYDWVIVWANPEGKITRMRVNPRPEMVKSFSQIGDLSKAAVNQPDTAVWNVARPGAAPFRLIAQGVGQRATSLYMFGPQPRRFDERTGHVAEQRLCLGIAEDRLGGGGMHDRGEAHRDQHGKPDEQVGGPAARTGSFSHTAPISSRA
jgi:hypothetical protein